MSLALDDTDHRGRRIPLEHVLVVAERGVEIAFELDGADRTPHVGLETGGVLRDRLIERGDAVLLEVRVGESDEDRAGPREGVDVIGIPGGFSFGDYLRCGAIAANSPVCQSVAAHAARGGYVIGICNGFQVLTETGLLPGALLRKDGLKYI